MNPAMLEAVMAAAKEEYVEERNARLEKDPGKVLEALFKSEEYRQSLKKVLTYGDTLVQVKRGDGYRYNFHDTPVLFIKSFEQKDPKETEDIVIAIGIDRRDGEVLQFTADSYFFEKVERHL